MSLDRSRLAELVEDIERSLVRLERLGEMNEAQFRANEDAQDIARSRLLTAVEAALSICFHVAAKRLQQVPKEYAECFGTLAEGGLLDADLARRLMAMARFRNRLIHVYWDTDYAQVYRIIHEDLGDLRAFVGAVGTMEQA